LVKTVDLSSEIIGCILIGGLINPILESRILRIGRANHLGVLNNASHPRAAYAALRIPSCRSFREVFRMFMMFVCLDNKKYIYIYLFIEGERERYVFVFLMYIVLFTLYIVYIYTLYMHIIYLWGSWMFSPRLASEQGA